MVDIRTAALSDCQSIATLDAAGRDEAWSRESHKKSLQASMDADQSIQSWVAEMICDGVPRVCGFIISRMVRDEAVVLAIVVEEAHQRCGIGSALMGYFASKCQRQMVERVFLDVRKGNHQARIFYEGLGYQQQGIRSSYYADGEDAIGLGLELSQTSSG